MNYIAFGLGLIWFAVMSLLNSYADPFLGFFLNIVFAGLIGLIAAKIFKNTLSLILLFPLLLIAFIAVIIGNISASYIPISIFIAFQLARYLSNKRWSVSFICLLIIGIGLSFSYGVLPKYYLFLQETTKKGEGILSFEYTTNSGSVVGTPSDKPIILEFWNSRCNSCFRKMKMLEELQEQINNKCYILCVYADFEDGVNKNLPKYSTSLIWAQNKYNLSFAYDSLYYHYNKELGLPQTIIVAPNGKILYSDVGYIPGNKKAIMEKYKSVINQY